MKSLLLGVINWYQQKGGGQFFFSVDCNYDPSCSEYTKQAIAKYGAFKGPRLGLKRIKRCNGRDIVTKEYDPLL